MIAAARSNAQLAETARQGFSVLGRDTPAAARLENMARFLDLVGECITRAAEQVREILSTKSATTLDGAPATTDRVETAVSTGASGDTP